MARPRVKWPFLVYRYEVGNEAQMYGSLRFSVQGLGTGFRA